MLITILIIVALIAIILFLVHIHNKNSNPQVEAYVNVNTNEPVLDDFYDPVSNQVATADMAICDPSCCTSQWPIKLDGLTPEEVDRAISYNNFLQPKLGSNMRCSIGATGCPCLTEEIVNNIMGKENLNFMQNNYGNSANLATWN